MSLMLFSTSKTGHFAQILTSGLLGNAVVAQLTPPDPGQIELYGHLIIQVLVAIVTIWATIRKALQQPEAVVKLPAAGVGAAPVSAAAPATPVEPVAATPSEFTDGRR